MFHFYKQPPYILPSLALQSFSKLNTTSTTQPPVPKTTGHTKQLSPLLHSPPNPTSLLQSILLCLVCPWSSSGNQPTGQSLQSTPFAVSLVNYKLLSSTNPLPHSVLDVNNHSLCVRQWFSHGTNQIVSSPVNPHSFTVSCALVDKDSARKPINWLAPPIKLHCMRWPVQTTFSSPPSSLPTVGNPQRAPTSTAQQTEILTATCGCYIHCTVPCGQLWATPTSLAPPTNQLPTYTTSSATPTPKVTLQNHKATLTTPTSPDMLGEWPIQSGTRPLLSYLTSHTHQLHPPQLTSMVYINCTLEMASHSIHFPFTGPTFICSNQLYRHMYQHVRLKRVSKLHDHSTHHHVTKVLTHWDPYMSIPLRVSSWHFCGRSAQTGKDKLPWQYLFVLVP